MDAKMPREWMQDARQVVGTHEIISNCAAHLHARTLNDIGSLFFEGVENLTTEESVGQGYTLYSAGFTLPIALESTAEEALATPLSALGFWLRRSKRSQWMRRSKRSQWMRRSKSSQ